MTLEWILFVTIIQHDFFLHFFFIAFHRHILWDSEHMKRETCLVWYVIWSTQWLSQLRHCTTSQQVMGMIADRIIEIFYWLNSSDCPVTLGLTQPVTVMNTWGYLLGVKGAWFVGLTTLPPLCANCLVILGALKFLEPSRNV